MMPPNYPKKKLGQVDLINTSVEDLQFGWTQTVFLPRWAVFPDLISDTAHLNEDDHGSHGPCYRSNQLLCNPNFICSRIIGVSL